MVEREDHTLELVRTNEYIESHDAKYKWPEIERLNKDYTMNPFVKTFYSERNPYRAQKIFREVKEAKALRSMSISESLIKSKNQEKIEFFKRRFRLIAKRMNK